VEIRDCQPGEPDYGARLVSIRPLRRGDLIFKISGREVIQSYKSVQVGSASHIEDDTLLAYLNHSCRPNIIVHTVQRKVFALCEVRAGDELTFFYPSTEWTMVRPFRCLCGSAGCLGLIAGAKYVPRHTLSWYFLNHHIRSMAAGALSSNLSAGPWFRQN
jgi:SET domain